VWRASFVACEPLNLHPGRRHNSPQHPMRGRSLARRLRGSVRATLCVALPERTGRARVSGRTFGGPESHESSRRWYNVG
jgi:hypothetical protein